MTKAEKNVLEELLEEVRAIRALMGGESSAPVAEPDENPTPETPQPTPAVAENPPAVAENHPAVAETYENPVTADEIQVLNTVAVQWAQYFNEVGKNGTQIVTDAIRSAGVESLTQIGADRVAYLRVRAAIQALQAMV